MVKYRVKDQLTAFLFLSEVIYTEPLILTGGVLDVLRSETKNTSEHKQHAITFTFQ